MLTKVHLIKEGKQTFSFEITNISLTVVLLSCTKNILQHCSLVL